MEIIENFRVTLDFQVSVNEETGEITTNCVKKSIDKTNFKSEDVKPKRSKVKKEESSEPTLTLEDNKYCLNTAAVELLQVSPDDKLDIKYEKQGKEIIPVIGRDESFGTHNGCRLTKSNTVSCRGSKNVELAKHGTEFILVSHSTKDGIFILKNKDAKDDIIDNSEEEAIDIDLQDLIDDTATITEVDSSIFKL